MGVELAELVRAAHVAKTIGCLHGVKRPGADLLAVDKGKRDRIVACKICAEVAHERDDEFLPRHGVVRPIEKLAVLAGRACDCAFKIEIVDIVLCPVALRIGEGVRRADGYGNGNAGLAVGDFDRTLGEFGD